MLNIKVKDNDYINYIFVLYCSINLFKILFYYKKLFLNDIFLKELK